VADSYNRGADAYEALWSPVILPPAAALVRRLPLIGRCVVADVGAGTGALVSVIRSVAPAARVIALDASAGMLQLARTRRGAAAIVADALALPLADATTDAVLLAYVLFHLADPLLAITEAARVLRPGGRIAAITWASERTPVAETVWDQTLAEAGLPPVPPRRVDNGLNRSAELASMLRSAGLRPERIWHERLHHQWDQSSFWELATGRGTDRIRLSHVSADTRADILGRAQRRLSQLAPPDYLWEGEIICAVAAREMSRKKQPESAPTAPAAGQG
jgi:SAM-dependent methyltransferase